VAALFSFIKGHAALGYAACYQRDARKHGMHRKGFGETNMNNYHNFIHELVVDLKELSYLCSQVRKNTIMTTIDLTQVSEVKNSDFSIKKKV
jgi:hypothetical protein